MGWRGLALLGASLLAACQVAGLPTPLPAQTPDPAVQFDFPLDPARYGPYVPYESGPLPVDTRFGAQNPGVGKAGKCFIDLQGNPVPFEQLYHAGEDWFVHTGGQVDGLAGIGAPVRAVANGVVTWAESLGSEGNVLVLEHILPDGAHLWSAYWHLTDIQVAVGQAVRLGQVIGRLHNRGANTHLHWELRTFGNGRDLFPPDSAGGRGQPKNCNGHVAAVGYTWDDDPSRAGPEVWGYLNPSEFIR